MQPATTKKKNKKTKRKHPNSDAYLLASKFVSVARKDPISPGFSPVVVLGGLLAAAAGPAGAPAALAA